MAAFANMAAAETRAKAKVADKTWVVAFATRTFSGAPAVRFQRFMSPTNPGYGAWVETTDDGTV